MSFNQDEAAIGHERVVSQPNRKATSTIGVEACVAVTPASKKTPVVIDLTSSPSSTRSRSPVERQVCSSDEEHEFSPLKSLNHGRNKVKHSNNPGAKKPVEEEIDILTSSDEETSSDDEDDIYATEPEKVEDGIIGMRIRTPGRKST